jgi:hypothetical protein
MPAADATATAIALHILTNLVIDGSPSSRRQDRGAAAVMQLPVPDRPSSAHLKAINRLGSLYRPNPEPPIAHASGQR